MKKDHPTSESAFFNPRIFAAFMLCSFGAWIAMLSFASTPSSGTLTTASGAVTYTAGPFLQANPSPLGLGQVDQGPRCNGTTFPCDSFDLTVSLPAGYTGTHCNAAVKVTLSWVDAGTGQSDYDLYIYEGVVGNLGGNTPADFQSATSGYRPEIASVAPLKDGPTITRSRSYLSNPLVRQLMSKSSYFLDPAVVALPGLAVPIRPRLIRHVTLPLTRRPVLLRK